MNRISNSRWVDADRFFSCVPLVSWIVGVVNLIQMTTLKSATIPLSDRYFTHLQNKTKEDLLFLFIPFIGNFILFLKYAKEKVEYKEEDCIVVKPLKNVIQQRKTLTPIIGINTLKRSYDGIEAEPEKMSLFFSATITIPPLFKKHKCSVTEDFLTKHAETNIEILEISPPIKAFIPAKVAEEFFTTISTSEGYKISTIQYYLTKDYIAHFSTRKGLLIHLNKKNHWKYLAYNHKFPIIKEIDFQDQIKARITRTATFEYGYYESIFQQIVITKDCSLKSLAYSIMKIMHYLPKKFVLQIKDSNKNYILTYRNFLSYGIIKPEHCPDMCHVQKDSNPSLFSKTSHEKRLGIIVRKNVVISNPDHEFHLWLHLSKKEEYNLFERAIFIRMDLPQEDRVEETTDEIDEMIATRFPKVKECMDVLQEQIICSNYLKQASIES
jgi:hypothetical protein